MAKLTTSARKKLPAKAFAVPGKKAYPIQDKAHARNALARVSQHGSPSQKKTVKAAVCEKYPTMGSCKKGKK